MNPIKKYIEGNEYKWFWFFLTFGGSCLPIIARFLCGLSSSIEIFDIKDVLFAGLAMNLSNLNLVGNKKIEAKVVISLLSVALIFLCTLIIGIFLCTENSIDSTNGLLSLKQGLCILKVLSGILVAFSIYWSYNANNYVFENS